MKQEVAEETDYMNFPKQKWTDMNEAAISKADCSNWICVLPLGAHEQHGHHLPFETDTIIADGIALRLASELAPTLPVTFLPTETVGYSIEHMDFKGSKTLGFNEAILRWIGIGEKLSQSGITKLLLLNAHGGNSPLMTIVATELRVRFSMMCVATSWTRFLEVGDELSQAEKSFGIHGGDVETSVMLALSPENVDMERADNFPSFQEKLAGEYQYLRAYGPHAFGWKMQDLNGDGVTGNASAANAEKGERLINQSVKGLAALIREMHQFDASRFQG